MAGAYVPLPKWIGQVQALKGDFTLALPLRSKSAYRLERLIGFRAGRLRDGWWLMFLNALPTVDQFEYRGGTHFSGGIVQGHLARNTGGMTAEARLIADGHDMRKSKLDTLATQFTVLGSNRIAKVRPVARAHGNPGIPDYPPGDAIPQWTLTQPLFWKAAAFIAPGHVYSGNYT